MNRRPLDNERQNRQNLKKPLKLDDSLDDLDMSTINKKDTKEFRVSDTTVEDNSINELEDSSHKESLESNSSSSSSHSGNESESIISEEDFESGEDDAKTPREKKMLNTIKTTTKQNDEPILILDTEDEETEDEEENEAQENASLAEQQANTTDYRERVIESDSEEAESVTSSASSSTSKSAASQSGSDQSSKKKATVLESDGEESHESSEDEQASRSDLGKRLKKKTLTLDSDSDESEASLNGSENRESEGDQASRLVSDEHSKKKTQILDSDSEESPKTKNKSEHNESLSLSEGDRQESMASTSKQLNYDNDDTEEIINSNKINSTTKSASSSVIELTDDDDNSPAVTSKFAMPSQIKKTSVQTTLQPNGTLTPLKRNKYSEDRVLGSYSPNSFPVKNEKLKAIPKLETTTQMKMLSLEDNKQLDEKMAQAFNASSFQAQPMRGTTVTMTNKYKDYESLLLCLSKEIIEEMEKKPDADLNYDDMEMPSGLKVKLLTHQLYSMKWLRWVESRYPHGGILADDMGLGKTLTILAYLKYIKDEKEKSAGKKLQSKNKAKEEKEEDEDEEELFDKKRIFKKKYGASSRDALPEVSLRTLIVLPASLLHQWQGEIKSKFERDSFTVHVYHEANRKKLAFNLEDKDIVFTTYEIVSREMDIFDKEGNPTVQTDSPLAKIKWKRIILDEAHRIKNHVTKASKACSFIKAKYRIAITGTPIHNSINDFYSLCKFIHFSPLDDFSMWKYLFACLQPKAPAKPDVTREKRSNDWVFLLSKYLILRRTKSDKIAGTDRRMVDLPDKVIKEVLVKLNSEEKAIYQKIFKEAQNAAQQFLTTQKQRELGKLRNNDAGAGGGGMTGMFVMILRLRQACCHMSLLSECLDKDELKNMKIEVLGEEPIEDLMKSLNINNTINSEELTQEPAGLASLIHEDVDLSKCLRRKYMSSKITQLLDLITEIQDEHPGDKMIVVSQWVSMLDVVAKNLDDRDIAYCEIKGDVKLFQRNEIVEDFNKETNRKYQIMLLSLTAGGVGLNIVGANRMFLLDIHWNPALEQQCADRIYRVGQKKECTIYKFLCENTIEQRIRDVQSTKLSMAEKVCDAKISTDGIKSNKLSTKDLQLLFKDFE
jgi:transcription termination factor 2